MTWPPARFAAVSPEVIAMAKHLGPSAIVVYAALALRANKSATCWPSVPTICADCGLSRSHVLRALASLEAAGLACREKLPGCGNRYRLSAVPTSAAGGTGPTGAAGGTAPVPPAVKTSSAGDTWNRPRTKTRTNDRYVKTPRSKKKRKRKEADQLRLDGDDGALCDQAKRRVDRCWKAGLRPNDDADRELLEQFAMACALDIFSENIEQQVFEGLENMELARPFGFLIAELKKHHALGFARMKRLRVPNCWSHDNAAAATGDAIARLAASTRHSAITPRSEK